MTRNVPYYCPLCINERGCGYNGLLRFPNQDVPVCMHHTAETSAPEGVKMVPTRDRKK